MLPRASTNALLRRFNLNLMFKQQKVAHPTEEAKNPTVKTFALNKEE